MQKHEIARLIFKAHTEQALKMIMAYFTICEHNHIIQLKQCNDHMKYILAMFGNKHTGSTQCIK